MPNSRTENLLWDAAKVAKVMARKGIPHREELARRIQKPATTVRRSFNDQWEGESTGPIVTALSRSLGVDGRMLLRDPRKQ